jgi:TPR repeat protein
VITAAALQGDSEAQYQLGEIYDAGLITPRDCEYTSKWWTKAAAQGHPLAQDSLNQRELLSTERSRVQITSAAEKGDAEAQFQLGGIYDMGRGVPINHSAAVEWWAKASAQGHAQAQEELGYMYKVGDTGVFQNKTKALKWLTEAANQGRPHALFSLGCQYKDGDGVQKDIKKGVGFLEAAAEFGHAGAALLLARVYRRGDPGGISKDVKKALRCWIHAAEQGELEAQEILRNLYLTGDARVQCAQDLHEAFRWGRTAAEQGGAKAQSQLGNMYMHHGDSVLVQPMSDSTRTSDSASSDSVLPLQMAMAEECVDKGGGTRWVYT